MPWNRDQTVLVVSLLLLCWLGMQAVHELGHVAGAWITGGHVKRVVLDPFSISRTDVSPNPHPEIEVWLGPVAGSLIPLLSWLATLRTKRSWSYLVRFFAGFCLVANGCYLGVGAFFPMGDAADLLSLGQRRWVLVLFGFATVPAGFALWNGQGPTFGIGPNASLPNRRHARWLAIAAVAVLAIELLLYRWPGLIA